LADNENPLAMPIPIAGWEQRPFYPSAAGCDRVHHPSRPYAPCSGGPPLRKVRPAPSRGHLVRDFLQHFSLRRGDTAATWQESCNILRYVRHIPSHGDAAECCGHVGRRVCSISAIGPNHLVHASRSISRQIIGQTKRGIAKPPCLLTLSRGPPEAAYAMPQGPAIPACAPRTSQEGQRGGLDATCLIQPVIPATVAPLLAGAAILVQDRMIWLTQIWRQRTIGSGTGRAF
jgi:hypothetical protein